MDQFSLAAIHCATANEVEIVAGVTSAVQIDGAPHGGTLRHVVHTLCALSRISSASSLCRIFAVRSSGSSIHGGGAAEDGEAVGAVGIGGSVSVIE